MTIGVSIEVEMRLLCIPPGQSFGSGTFSIKRSPLKKKKRYLSDILNLLYFHQKRLLCSRKDVTCLKLLYISLTRRMKEINRGCVALLQNDNRSVSFYRGGSLHLLLIRTCIVGSKHFCWFENKQKKKV